MSDPPSDGPGIPTPGPPEAVRRLMELNDHALQDPERFWGEVAGRLLWSERTGPVRTPIAEPPFARWFAGWRTNIAYNCLDRWVGPGEPERIAFHWVGEPGDGRTISYRQLYVEVNRFASVLRRLGVGEGDRVTIYLPMIPEAVVAMLAVVRLGAVHTVVFGGFASQPLADRINDSTSKLLITADGGWRGGRAVELKRIADAALPQTPSIEHVVVVRRTGRPVEMTAGRDLWYHELLQGAEEYVAPTFVNGGAPSFILYTSGTTGKPKGVVHSTGGYLVWLEYTMRAVFAPSPRDVYWCTADIGWVTGHSYVVYGPLLGGTTSFLYEGGPNTPAPDRWWEMVERHRITILLTSPTAIRGFIQSGDGGPAAHDLTSLRLLGSVGEPINPAAWTWFHERIGGGRCPIVDTYWQTETGGIVIAPQPGIAFAPLKPGSATSPIAGIDAAVVGATGAELPRGQKGLLVIRQPWPGEFIGLWHDVDRYRSVYFSRFPGSYFTADYAVQDPEGYFWLLGRADEVMKVAGHLLSTKEVEDALATHPAVAESAVIGRSDAVKGEVPVACVILKPGVVPSAELRQELSARVRTGLGAFAIPAAVYLVPKLPKTRSGKIMRRLIRDVVEERALGDVSTLEDEDGVEAAKRAYRELRDDLGPADQ